MIEMEVSCSNCGRIHPQKFQASKTGELTRISKTIEKTGWIVEINGDYLDTYCSKKCAE